MGLKEVILDIMREKREINARSISEISEKLEISYDTISKHLKRMTKEGKIKKYIRFTERKPPVYYYSVHQ